MGMAIPPHLGRFYPHLYSMSGSYSMTSHMLCLIIMDEVQINVLNGVEHSAIVVTIAIDCQDMSPHIQ